MAPYHVFHQKPDFSRFAPIYDGNLEYDLDNINGENGATNSPNDTENLRIFALDCEMVYTTNGSELARLSVVDESFNTVIDMVVQPTNPVIDCNTEFSGLTKKDLAGISILPFLFQFLISFKN